MKIIIDSREQLPLSFTGHETITRKLDEGDYNIAELEDKIVIERKSPQDLYQSITINHERFKNEILRSKKKNKTFYIFLECDLIHFYSKKWSDRALQTKKETLKKILETMIERHKIIVIECKDRDEMSKKIEMEMEKWLTQQKQ